MFFVLFNLKYVSLFPLSKGKKIFKFIWMKKIVVKKVSVYKIT
jgi:hypothetical protein